jgi:3-oxoacyl-[acyl-carrier protein] reductase
MTNSDLKNKVALITGASRGLGAAIATKLALHGAKVAINYLAREKDAASVKKNIISNNGIAEIFPADVTDEGQVADLCTNATKRLGPIDILVINATLFHVLKPMEELKWKDFTDHFEFFVKSPLLLAQQVLPHMKKQKNGRIIQIGSETFDRGLPGFSNYVAAKGAQLGLTRSWAGELGSHGITVNLVAPGWIPTEMHAADPEEKKQDYASRVPLGRMGSPQDVAGMVAYLASDSAEFITGQRISVNGGLTMV